MKSIILDNGIKVQYLNRPELSLFTLNLFLLKGAVYDPPNKEGVAHFVEHILMKGPKYFKSSIEFSQFLENRGIEFDGHTTPDYICLNIKCHQSEAYKATKLMIDMLTEPSIRPTDISNEKK
ncbi:insulinase family protein [Alkalihalobacillus sp. LMS39]|uniref:M16 family metallopeptidase n=1 Tax=Alkalihalobacillus sp. LMS39 TaxID=2924032 RepID=UPI001FB4F978|nr:insulinase family protein [Alkalihalobacillus sp. LMS39]UOE95083.1 insulinase family protein [Alkalihalobacillus sp. LMS39]